MGESQYIYTAALWLWALMYTSFYFIHSTRWEPSSRASTIADGRALGSIITFDRIGGRAHASVCLLDLSLGLPGPGWVLLRARVFV